MRQMRPPKIEWTKHWMKKEQLLVARQPFEEIEPIPVRLPTRKSGDRSCDQHNYEKGKSVNNRDKVGASIGNYLEHL